ncbi:MULTISPECIES: hypothetical protein [Sorangium]|uniref:hypothetical protein n=1 Tax=Sorangium TaxID=39643 RepID=UPI000310FA7E|nr:hypothetical protein [Sorangium cellulosum]
MIVSTSRLSALQAVGRYAKLDGLAEALTDHHPLDDLLGASARDLVERIDGAATNMEGSACHRTASRARR